MVRSKKAILFENIPEKKRLELQIDQINETIKLYERKKRSLVKKYVTQNYGTIENLRQALEIPSLQTE